jgi:zinc protease
MSQFSPLKGVSFHELPNGLRILLKEDHAWPLVSLHTWVRVGSVDEQPAQAGLSHVLEHMVFKGTTQFNAGEISRWVEQLGGGMNAETSKEYTHYYIDVPGEGARQAIRLLGDLMHQASFDAREWERERPVILEEIKRRNDDPEALLWDLLNEALFQDENLARPVIGSGETVSAVTREDLQSFYQTFYRGPRMVLVVAGDFHTSRMLQWIKKAFGGMPSGAGPFRREAHLPSYTPKHVSLKRPVEQVYIAMGFPTPPANHPDHEALDLLAAVLGDGRSSRLVQSLREKKKLVWSVSAANYGHEGPGLFSVFAECSPARRKQLKPEVEQIFRALRRGISGDEVARAKNLMESGWLQSYETYHQQASTLGLYALDNQLDRLNNYLPKLLSLTPRALAQVAERYLHTHPLSTAVVAA